MQEAALSRYAAQDGGNSFGVLSMAVRLVLVPLIYQGLLSISVVIYDPFGPDVLDFPVVAYAKSHEGTTREKL